MSSITVLIPTKDRITALGATLTSLLFQEYTDFSVIISDQSQKYDVKENPTIKTLIQLFQENGQPMKIVKHLPTKGLAEQREFLLTLSQSEYSLFLDDDIIVKSFVVKNMMSVIEKEHCGFVGNAVIGLSYKDDRRPQEQHIEFWDSFVTPEKIIPGDKKWKRYTLHNAANLYHIASQMGLSNASPRPYKIAWVGGCTLYNTQKLRNVGGFGFWKDLPKEHVGEDVLAQLKVMEKFGGCGIIPSGAFHQELPTTLIHRKVNAPEYIK